MHRQTFFKLYISKGQKIWFELLCPTFYRVTLGNQLDGVKLLEPDVVKAFKKRYPDGQITWKAISFSLEYRIYEETSAWDYLKGNLKIK